MRRTTVLALAATTILAVVLAACDDNKAADTPAKVVAPTVTVTTGTVDVQRAGSTGDLTPEQANAITATVAAYFQRASVEPFVAASSAPDGLDSVFTADALAAATGPDRESVTDTGLPKPTRDVSLTVAPTNLTPLFDPNGEIVYVSASIEQQLGGAAGNGPVTIRRSGELVLVPCRDNACPTGQFRVRSYAVIAQRTLPDGTTTTAKGKK